MSLREEIGIRHRFSERGSISARVGAIVSPGTLDIRDLSAPIVPILDHAYGAAEARVPLSPDLLLFANAMLIAHDEFVARGRLRVGVESPVASASLEVEGSLGEWSGIDPGFLEGSRRRAIANFVLNPIPEVSIRATGSMDLEEGPDGERDVSATGSVETRW